MDLKDVLLPPLHIKLSLVKDAVKVFRYLRCKFYRLTAAKANGDIFVGTQIRQLEKNLGFNQVL